MLDGLAGEPCLAAPRRPNKPLALYGAGNFGLMALDFLNEVGVRPVLVVDANAERIRQSPPWQGIDVHAPDEVPDSIKSETLLALSVVTSPVAPILADLARQGWKDCVPFYDVAESFRPAHPLSNGWFAEAPESHDLAKIARCLDHWADDLSRAHHLTFLAWRLARQEWRFEGVAVDNSNRFFIPEVLAALRPDDLFVDGGAHHGGVSQAFLATGASGRIVAFEPDEANAERYGDWRATLPADRQARIEIRREALDAAPRERPFHEGLGYMSQFAVSGAQALKTTTLDATGLAPGFIKLHLEGAELDALKGGLETFRQSRPVIAATVYHNADGLWRTARWLADHLENYTLIFRTHSWCGTGAVIYAIPGERRAAA